MMKNKTSHAALQTLLKPSHTYSLSPLSQSHGFIKQYVQTTWYCDFLNLRCDFRGTVRSESDKEAGKIRVSCHKCEALMFSCPENDSIVEKRTVCMVAVVLLSCKSHPRFMDFPACIEGLVHLTCTSCTFNVGQRVNMHENRASQVLQNSQYIQNSC